MEGLLILKSSLTTIVPPIFPVAVMYEKREPMHRALADYFDIHMEVSLKFLPLMIFIGYVIFQITSTISFLVTSGILYCQLVHGWVGYFIRNYQG